MRNVALITGITGQDGSYLAEFLLEKGYEVHGIVRKLALEHPEQRLWRIRHITKLLHLHVASIDSLPSLYRVIGSVRPAEIYHLAAQSFVAASFEDEFTTMATNVQGTHYMLSAARDLAPHARFYFAGSSEMFGTAEEVPQKETTPFRPRSPYAISKVAGFELTRNYREAYGLFACSGILHNHESPRRGLEFVTRRITSQVAKIKLGLDTELRLGNVNAMRDWGHARAYVRAMWLMLQESSPDDYVIASGETHSVRQFADMAFAIVGLDVAEYLKVDRDLMRPTDVQLLCGDTSKARAKLGWTYELSFRQLVQEMVETDLEFYSRNASRTVVDQREPAIASVSRLHS